MFAGDRFNIFYSENSTKISLESRDSSHLLQRAFLKNSSFRNLVYVSNDYFLKDKKHLFRNHSFIITRDDRSYQIVVFVSQ